MAKIGGRGSSPLLLNNPPAQVKVVEHFKERKLVMFDRTRSFDVSEVIAERIANANGDAVTNITIHVKSGVDTFFINLFTLGFAGAIIFQVEGDIVQTPNGLSSALESTPKLVVDGSLKEMTPYLKDGLTFNGVKLAEGDVLAGT